MLSLTKNMKIYCTICCKEKRKDKEPLEAINRYISTRIETVYNKSKTDNVEFRILSSKFGLLKPDIKIPWYDQKLTLEHEQELKDRVKEQINQEKIDHIVFFVGNIEEDPNWKQYLSLISDICSENNLVLEMSKTNPLLGH
jgi:hypothetical protein